MSAQELQQLVEILRGGPVSFSAPPAEMRPIFEGMLVGLPGDASTVTTEREIGGVSGLWMDAAAGGSADRVLLYLHGGGYTIGSALAYRELSTQLAKAAGVGLFTLDYRLAPEHPFPAAVEDAVAAYHGLLDLGFRADHITVAGDSAGGGLTLALLLELRDAGIPLPARAALLSPWLDLTLSGRSIRTKAAADASLDAPGLQAAATHYLAGLPAEAPPASPLFAELAGLPPLLLEVGEAEILLSDSVRLAKRAAEAGVDVTLHVWPGMPHVWPLFAALLGEGRDAINEVGAFLGRDR